MCSKRRETNYRDARRYHVPLIFVFRLLLRRSQRESDKDGFRMEITEAIMAQLPENSLTHLAQKMTAVEDSNVDITLRNELVQHLWKKRGCS